MDFPKGAGTAAYDEKSETDIYRRSYSWQIPINHDDLKIVKKNESQLCEVLQDKFGCISILVSPAQEHNSESLQVFRKMLTPGLTLSVWKDNLTRHAVDAVVNAANEDLKHGGGLALALVKAGGQEIQEKSTRLVSTRGKVPTGEIAVTGAGKLPCKLIIHAVGPRWVEVDRERCIHKLQTAIKNILDYAIFYNMYLETVAIPALSSGIFNFPLNLCTQIIVETIRLYFQGVQTTGNLKEIHLVSNEEPTVAAFKAASETILGMNELRSWGNQEATPPFNTMVMSNFTVHIVRGQIELQETDVIVNSITPSHCFEAGLVSRSILQQAGDEIEQEFKKQTSQTSQDSQLVLVTKGFKLSCQYVFHVLWNSEYSRTDMRLKNAVRKCLEKCLELSLTSISFPALGTGNIGVCKDQAAKIMLDEVLMFACNHLRKQLTVKFVIFPTEMETYKAFSTEMERHKFQLQILSNNGAPWKTREEKQENGLKAKSSAIDLMGSHWERMNEAEKWIKRLLTCQDKHVIENKHILYLGKKEHDILSQLQNTSRVSIEEIIDQEKTILEIKGAQADIVEAVINIEHMLCEIQEKMAREREQALWNLLGQWTGQQPKTQDEMKKNKFLKHPTHLTQEIQDRMKQFEYCGLQVIKVEKVDNEALMAAFQKKKKMMEGRNQREPTSRRLFQQVPQQFCEVVCRVGFQRMYSAPCDPKYGAGIYFTKNLKNLAYQVKKTSATDNLICVFEAEVLTGSFCQGHELNIVPPPLSPGDINSHDSVVDNVSSPETFVIFSGVQAMPQYLWTCTRMWQQDYSLKPQPLGGKFSSGSSVD